MSLRSAPLVVRSHISATTVVVALSDSKADDRRSELDLQRGFQSDSFTQAVSMFDASDLILKSSVKCV